MPTNYLKIAVGLPLLLIALLTVAGQTLRAATAGLTTTLRAE